MKKFIDTSPFIYLIENHPVFADKVEKLIINSLLDGDTFKASVITFLEFGVVPERENRPELIQEFEDLLFKLNISLTEVDKSISRNAYQLRAKYEFLKSMDAIQLATALSLGCEEFITNDLKLKRVKELPVIIINSLI